MHQRKHKIGVWMPNWVGDACMATPALRSLAEAFGHEMELVGIMQPVIRDLLAGTPWLDRTVIFDRLASDGIHSRMRMIGALRSLELDTLILLTNSWWTAAVGRLAGIRRLVGYDRDWRGWLLSDRVPVPRNGKKPRPLAAVDYYLQLTHTIGCSSDDRRMRLSVLPEDQRRADQLWQQLNFAADVPTLVINNSGATSPSRLWPTEHVESLARRIIETLPAQVLLHCGPAERQACNASAERIAHARVRSMGVAAELPLGLSKAVLARAHVIVSTDSGPRHLAIALDRPVISLFGSTDPSWTATYNGHETIIAEKLDCRPCWAKTCPLQHHRCMQLLGVEGVYEHVARSLRNRESSISHEQ